MTLNAKAMVFLAATARDIQAGGPKYDQGVPSPCMSVCQMDDDTALCQGCLRTLDEIRQWGNASDTQRRAVWQAIAARTLHYAP
ncbi:DUF1289 domain-containing protein [Rhodoferax sp. U2-2l]|uniref:DUF1289 domain-containing protein n=1 Tax=Rhodoferax sp. U2-2l TaxID=2884000 RepID=UPI001D0B2854|nr:DUF1289 domain-containing protein [Rhodoferax sp. U2-2l]MCB8748639.1 DUF1289 domain-containing protein [Rhodoferax sp. U2-2l]